MVSAENFYNFLNQKGINFFTGVPDSTLKNFCSFLQDNVSREKHIIAANEGNAVGLAIGNYLSTKKPALVYMQNSGQGNSLNPLVSLADKEIYQIPILLLIGWRGFPEEKDEPQHIKQGKITLELLSLLGIPYSILRENNFKEAIEKALNYINETSSSYALIVKKRLFEEYISKKSGIMFYELTREKALETILLQIPENSIIISTTGMLSRELFELREKLKQSHEKDFLTIGGMGHNSSIALSIALTNPNKQIFCLDGDGSLLMHLGSLATITKLSPKNFKHIIFNNESHESVGGQPTSVNKINLPQLALSIGYNSSFSAHSLEKLNQHIVKLINNQGPALLEIKIRKYHRKELGRPTLTPIQNKDIFMKNLNNCKK